ncbi:pre-rRNA processing protein [Malassezia brasiliensis]|uniref:Pre-rRNA processing protein n=1 Tax=Malassezia brasiliensis TaxID=1821822 RepID=A0AAF0IP66_9BASI|nr:pre-rRNA processing protein [Malassezia brasiliensis]
MQEDVERRAGLAEALGRVRHHQDSKLENQRAPAQLLAATEATLAERGDEPGPTHYFLALESLLAANDDPQSSVYTSSVYLLSIVLPFVSPGVVRAKCQALLAAVAQPLGEPHSGENANARLRASLGCIEVFLEVLPTSDRALLEHDKTWRTVWDLTLNLCVDSRPKVRRRAHELVAHVLALPAWKNAHPYAPRTVQWAAHVLNGVAAARGLSHTKPAKSAPEFDKRRGKAKHAMSAAVARQQAASEGAASTGIWVCALLKMIASHLPPATVEPLVKELLHLPSLQNTYLTVAVFDVFAALFATHSAESDSARAHVAALGTSSAAAAPAAAPDATMLRETLAALRNPDVVPAHTDVQTLPSYLALLEACMVAYSRLGDGNEAWALVPQVWADIMELALSAKSDASRHAPEVRTAGRHALLALLRYAVPDAAVLEACQSAKAPLAKMITSLRDALGRHAIRYAHARADVLAVLAGLIARLRYAPAPGAHPAAEALVMDIVEDVATLRTQKGFDARPEADLVLGAAIEACGPAAFLQRLPLQLLDAQRRPNTQGTGRAWLLPLLREHITNTQLQHFVDELVPLSEALFELRIAAESGGAKPVEAKVFEALIEQIWACFPAYCELARDVDTAITPQFLELLINVLRSQSALRPSVLKGLELLVQRSEALAASQAPAAQLVRQFGVDQAAGKRFVAHLRALSGVLFTALFNLLAELPSQARGYVMECIGTYLGILDAESVTQTYTKVAQMLEQSLATYTPTAHTGGPEPNSPRYVPPLPHTMLDLLVALVPFVQGTNAASLYDVASSDALLAIEDGGIQKKVYRILARLLSGREATALFARAGSAERGCAELLARLGVHTDDVQAGAVRDRLLLLGALAPLVGDAELHILGAMVPEAVLGTKETNQGAREAAYALLVAIGERMDRGGVLRRPDGEVAASANEYILMVAAGLAGATPRMISASITALARLLYEFHARLPVETLDELLSTMVVYLESTNREIIKSALGLTKVAIVVLDAPRVEAHLGELVPALIGVQVAHKNHFKGRVRHIIERLIRRFGVPAVEQYVDEDNKRLITNIRKRKERARRKKSAAATDKDDDAPDAFQRAPGTGSMDAFEEALYGSASESESDEDDAPSGRRGAAKPKPGRHAREDDAYLVEDDEVPLDLLERGTTTVRTKRTGHKERRPGDEAKKLPVDASGRLRIVESDDEAAESAPQPSVDDQMAGRAYIEKEMGIDGFTHTRGGAVKFNKNTKRTRANERLDDEDDEAPAPEGGARATKRPRPKKQAIGEAFRAKRAAGDVQRNGMSPYAYVPLSSVTGKKNAKQAQKLKITGRGHT